MKLQKIPSKLITENMKKARKKISLSKLAEKLGLSKSSVSRALSGSPGVSAKTAKAVAEAAKKFGYKKSVPLSRAMSFARSGAAGDFETIAFVNAKPARDFYGRYSAISKYVSAAKEAARRRGYAVCDIWLHEKNFTPAKFEKLAAARGIRGGIVFGHYYRDSVPAEFRGAMGKLKLVSMGVKSNAPVKSSVFMDRFLMVRGFVERIMRGGYGRAGFIVERFADKCDDGKFTGGFFAAQFGRTGACPIPPLYWENARGKNFSKIAEYARKYKLDAIFSYSTDVSEIIRGLPIGENIKIFHYDENFADPRTPRISNQKEVGRAAVETLSEMLCTAGRTGAKKPPEISIAPEWARAAPAIPRA